MTSRGGGTANLGQQHPLLQASTNPKKIPPGPGQKEQRVFDGKTYYWCKHCHRWCLSHGTADHGKKKQANLAQSNHAAQDAQESSDGFAGFSLANFQ